MRNEQKVKEAGLIPYYYYLKFGVTPNNQATLGTMSVCLLTDTYGRIHRGISFWPGNQFIRKAGRNVALGMVMQARSRMASSRPWDIPRKPTELREKIPIWIPTYLSGLPWTICLSDYDTRLSEIERARVLGL